MTFEKTADLLETASHLQDQLNLAGRKVCEAALAPETDGSFDGKHCVECKDEMPPVRLAYKRIRCAACQTEIERLAKLNGRR